MFTNISAAVERAVQDAQSLAQRAGATEICPEHMLGALLDQEGGSVEALLAGAGTDLSRKEEIFISAMGQGTDESRSGEDGNEAHFSPKMQEIWQCARQMAGELADHRMLGSEHLLLALLEKEPELRAGLEKFGMQYGQVQKQLRIRDPLPWDEPLALAEATEEIHVARILDASANRAREALRVLEDFCRFAWGDPFLSGQFKRMRHELADALAFLPFHHLLEARETERDVGRSLAAAGEENRHSLLAVVQANCKRLQEALRSLEEFGKIRSPDLGRTLEMLRYQSYTLERAMTLGNLARQGLAEVHLYVLVTDCECAGPLDWTIKEAAAGGAAMFQLREKDMSDMQLLKCARKVRRWTTEVGAMLIINDRPDIARLVNADGVHLGQEDMPVMEARQILGPERLIGISTHNLAQVRKAILDGASYIGVGPTFPSATKDFVEFAGLDFVRQTMQETSLPAFVIGGVTVENIDQVVAAGAFRVAVSRTIGQSPDPRRAAQELLRVLPHASS